MKAKQLDILSNVQVSQRYWHMKVDASTIPETIDAGQFFNIKCSNDDIFPFLRRPFSIYMINKQEKTLEFLYLVKGIGTQKLTLMSPGEKVDVLGPLGQGFTLDKKWKTIFLLARGVGIATLAALAQEASRKGIKCIAILSARSSNDLLATETLQGLGTQVYQVTDDEGTSDVKQVANVMRKIFQEEDIDAAFTCGSKRLSKLLQSFTHERQIPSQIALEEHMGCAMGVCFACVCDIKENNRLLSVRVCKEGPVFDLNKVVLR